MNLLKSKGYRNYNPEVQKINVNGKNIYLDKHIRNKTLREFVDEFK